MEEQSFRRLPEKLSGALVHRAPSMLDYKSLTHLDMPEVEVAEPLPFEETPAPEPEGTEPPPPSQQLTLRERDPSDDGRGHERDGGGTFPHGDPPLPNPAEENRVPDPGGRPPERWLRAIIRP